MTSSSPLARAGLCQQTLNTLRTLEPLPDHPALSARVLAHIPAAVIERIEGCGRNGWLPLDHDTLLLDALYREIGAEKYRAMWAERQERNLRGALMGPVMKVAISMFGQTPSGMLRFLPQAFQALFKDAGRIELVENDDAIGRGVAVLREPPDAPEALYESIAATLDAGIRFGGKEGGTAVSRNEGVVFTMEWR